MAYTVVDARAAHDEQVACNADLSEDDCVERVLAFLRDGEEHWAYEIAEAQLLTGRQVYFALEQLDLVRAIEEQKSDYGHGDYAWHVRSTAHGRNIANGKVPLHAASTTMITNNIQNSTVANAGIVTGTVTQHVAITISPLPEDVRAILEASDEGAVALETFEAEMHRPAPRVNVLAGALKIFEGIVGTAVVSTEIATHWSVWFQAAQHAISGH